MAKTIVRGKLMLALGLGLVVPAVSREARAVFDPVVNLALGKSTRQSSTIFEADSGRAVDGNADPNYYAGSVTHTDFDLHSWWEVDLGEVRQIGRVEIANRLDCCSERLVPMMVIVADIPIIDTDITDADADMFPGITRTIINGPVQANYAVPVNRSGQYVRIALVNQNYLSLAEVRVLEAGNAAYGRGATASSFQAGGEPYRATDGRTSGVFSSGSVAATNVELRPWWEVDLGTTTNIDQIDVWSSNTDCCSTVNPRPGFYVWISPTPITADPVTTFLPDVIGYHVNPGSPAVLHPDSSRLTRYVRVELDSTDSLSLAEVQVWPVARGAVGGHAKLSTTATGSDANNAIDLAIPGAPPAVSKSQTEPYLDVDLGGFRYLETVRLNSNSPTVFPASYRVFVSNTDFKNGSTPVTTVAGTLALPGVSNWITKGTSTYSTTVVMRQGRFVRVMLDGQQKTLTIPELQIATTQGVGAPSRWRNGTTTSTNPLNRTFDVTGYYPRPNVGISFYAFRPNVGAAGGTYVWLGAATTEAASTFVPYATMPVFTFPVTSVTLPADTFAASGVGGLVYQADDDLGAMVPLRSIDDDGSENVFWPDTRLIAMINTPDDNATKPLYLDSPLGTTQQTGYTSDALYSVSLDWPTFTAKYFSGGLKGLNNVGMADPPVSVSYFNRNELGLGRKVTCVRGFLAVNQQATPNHLNGTACAVEEYAPLDGTGYPIFGDEAGALNAIAGGQPISVSVIVTYDRTTPGGGGDYWFGSYKRSATGTYPRGYISVLDYHGHNNNMPNNCMTCHAGSGSLTTNHQGLRGYLLPFDTSSFGFSASAPFSSQAESFRKLSALVLTDSPTPQIADLVNGTYHNAVNTPGTAPDLNWVPDGWKKTPGQVKVYNAVIKPYCRACHQSQVASAGGIDFLKATDAENMRALIVSDVCVSHRMPHAQRTLKNFWRAGARAQLLGFFGRHDFDGEKCTP